MDFVFAAAKVTILAAVPAARSADGAGPYVAAARLLRNAPGASLLPFL